MERRTIVLNALRAICVALALTINYGLPDIDVEIMHSEAFTNIKLSMPENLFLVSVLTLLFYLVYKKMYMRKCNRAFRALCFLLSIIWVMCYSLSIDDSLGSMCNTKGQIVKTLILIIGIGSLLEVAGILLWDILRLEAEKSNSNTYINNWKTWGKDTGLLLCLWMPHIILAYPASMVTDTWAQIEMFYGLRPFSDHFTTTHTWLVGIFTLIGKNMHNGNIGFFLYILVQSIIFAMVISYEIYRMRELKAPKWLINLTFIVAIFSPYYTYYLGCILRDIIYAYFIMLFEIEWIYFIREGDRFWTSRLHKYLFMISVFCSILFRKNGKYVIYPMIILAVFVMLKSSKWKSVKELIGKMAVLFIPIVAAAVLTSGLDAYYGVEKSSIAEALSLPFQQTARYAKEYEEEVTDSERESIERVLRYETLAELYNPLLSDAVKGTFGFYGKPSKRDLEAYFKVWIKQFLKHPVCYVSATLNQNYKLLCPFLPSEYIRLSTLRGINIKEVNDILGIHEIDVIESFRDGLEDYYTLMYRMPVLQWFSNLAMYVYLIIFLLAYAVYHKVRKAYIAMAPIILCVLIVILAPCVSVRYALPFVYPIPIVVAYFIDTLQMKNKEIINDTIFS